MSYSLVIGDKEYTLPSDIPIDKWVELNKNSNPFVWMNSVYDIPIDEIKSIPEKTRELAIQLIKAIMNPTWVPIRQTLVDTELINFEDIKLGQFIDLEVYIDDYYTNYPNIVKILYQTENNVGNLGISQVHSAVTKFFTWRLLVYKQYKNLFELDIDGDDIVQVQQDKHVKPAHIWYDVVMTLSDNKFLNMDAVLEKPLIQSLNWLAWNKDKQRALNEQLRKR
tara:strand:- start:1184 stop:1852 length:669 start_codon:yes stop_codon:yes gene_type:complete